MGPAGVGASTAFNLALMRGAHEVVLVDNRPEHAHLPRDGPTSRCWSRRPAARCSRGDPSDVADSDVVVLLSATPLTLGTSRLEYLEKNAAIADELADRLVPGWGGLLIVVTNPVDPLVTRLQARTGFDRRRILGYTVNDSLRLRTGLAMALDDAAGQRRGVGAGRARRHERPPLRPRQGRRRAGRARRPTRRRPPRSTSAPSTCGTSRSTRVDRRPGPRDSASRAWSRRSTGPASCGPHRSCSTASTASTASRSPCR